MINNDDTSKTNFCQFRLTDLDSCPAELSIGQVDCLRLGVQVSCQLVKVIVCDHVPRDHIAVANGN